MTSKLQSDIKNNIKHESELQDIKAGTLNYSMRHILLDCLKYSLDIDSKSKNKLLEIESVIDFLNDELNTGHWSQVPHHLRRYFTIASYVKCLLLLKQNEGSVEDILRKCLKSLDVGLLLGAPLEKNFEILSDSAKYLRIEINMYSCMESNTNIQQSTNKRKIEKPKECSTLKGRILEDVDNPSLEYFNKKYFVPQLPVKLKGCLTHWPASKKWLDINYLLKIAGDRTVPIEIGSQYVDENWSQKLMTVKEFILKHYMSENGDIGYLAQHNLFEQITELRDDICIPEYCCLSLNYDDTTEPDVNAWFGPKGTISPLHTDPKNNLLAQVYGTKQIILFSPQDTPHLYPYGDKLLNNTAQVNPLDPDLEKYPEFSKTTMFKCLLEPGDMVFIPVKWWHHVTAIDKSFSVSFWWQ